MMHADVTVGVAEYDPFVLMNASAFGRANTTSSEFAFVHAEELLV